MQALGTRRESQRGEEDKTTTTTTARAQVKGRALTPESVLLGLVDLDTWFPVMASTSPSVKWTEG